MRAVIHTNDIKPCAAKLFDFICYSIKAEIDNSQEEIWLYDPPGGKGV